MSDIISALSAILPQESILTGKDTTVFECDGLTTYKALPLAVVLPSTVAQVQAIVKACNTHEVPIVPRGAGTGLSGGATPQTNGVVLGFSKLNAIKEINTENHSMVVEPGVINAEISSYAKEYGLYYAPDPSSQIACTIGGNIAENSGGVHCLKYGLTVHNIIQITYVDAEGELRTVHRDDDSLGLLSLLIGSEGLLGLVVEVTVKLLPIPAITKTLMADFASVTECAHAVANIIAGGVIPAGLEMMDEFSIGASNEFLGNIYPHSAALLLCDLDGTTEEVERDTAKVLAILQAAKSVQIATDESERILLWKGRKSAFPAVGRISPDYYCMDGTIPKRHLAEVLEYITELSNEFGLRVANVFHAGDGNLHPLILYDASKGEIPLAEELGERILKKCVDLGGTITGEHGVGLEKLGAMCYQFPKKELEIFHNIKKVFDTKGILNPTKAVPTLHRCSEVGRMHIHGNQDPHPHLERF